jgi:flagellar hook-associated protein 1 FlgK
VVEAGKALGLSLGELDQQLTKAAEVAEGEYSAITGKGGEVEGKAKEIALLNGAIRSSVTQGAEPNDLLDRRDLLLDELSELGQVSVTEVNDGTIEVGFGDAAAPLVSGTEVDWPQELKEPKGKLGALLELVEPGGTIESFRTELNGFAEGLADAVNAIHTKAGGPAFFSYEAGKGAASLHVAVTAAEVQTSSDGSAGGNEIATEIGALQGGSVDRGYAAFVTRIGAEMNEAKNGETNAQALLNAVEERRESTSGVSLDEEMTNLQRFQRGYEASARAMTALDEALDVLINRTGRVGL